MSANISIRRASADDIPALVELVRAYWTFEGIDGFDAARVAAVLRWFFEHPSAGTAWIASDASTAVAYLLACHVFSLEHGGLTAEIDEFFVVPDARGTGLGRRMLDSAERALAAEGCTSIALQVGRENAAGRAFYARSGYRDRDGYDLMEKSLATDDPIAVGR
jgi:GNAT superfamily N-acetyltransferase